MCNLIPNNCISSHAGYIIFFKSYNGRLYSLHPELDCMLGRTANELLLFCWVCLSYAEFCGSRKLCGILSGICLAGRGYKILTRAAQ